MKKQTEKKTRTFEKSAYRRIFLGTIIIVLLIAAAWMIYFTAGKQIIQSIYRRESLGALNTMITAQDTTPVQFYLDKAERMLWKVSYWGFFAVFVISAVFFIHKKKYWGVAAANLIIILAFYEIFMRLMMFQPNLIEKLPGKLVWQFRRIYMEERDLLPVIRNELYDEELGYVHREGRVRHKEKEFDVVYSFNSMGLRDDEESLRAPEIIVLGDSHGMGLGVPQASTFAHIIEEKIGKKLLNAAISSYATVREMRLLERLDTSRLKYLVVQYCSNDLDENRHYWETGRLREKLISPEAIQNQIAEQKKVQRYFPGKYALKLTAGIMTGIIDGENTTYRAILPPRLDEESRRSILGSKITSGPDESFLLLYALEHTHSIDLTGVTLILVVVDPYYELDPSLIRQIEQRKTDPGYPSYIRHMLTVQLADKLKENDFFLLDDHINTNGHAKVAEEIIRVMKEIENASKRAGP